MGTSKSAGGTYNWCRHETGPQSSTLSRAYNHANAFSVRVRDRAADVIGSSPDSPLEGDGFELVWGFSCPVVCFGLLPVLCSEVCPGKASMFSRRQSCRGKSQSPVVRIAEEMETEPSKPIDRISRGEITSHRAVSKENALWPRKK